MRVTARFATIAAALLATALGAFQGEARAEGRVAYSTLDQVNVGYYNFSGSVAMRLVEAGHLRSATVLARCPANCTPTDYDIEVIDSVTSERFAHGGGIIDLSTPNDFRPIQFDLIADKEIVADRDYLFRLTAAGNVNELAVTSQLKLAIGVYFDEELCEPATEFQSQVDAIEDGVFSLSALLDGITATVTEVYATVSSLSTEVARLKTGQTALATRLTALEAKVDALNAKMDTAITLLKRIKKK